MNLTYIGFFQIHDNKQDTNSFKIFQVPIGSSKCVEKFKFHSDSPMLHYFQKSLNICWFSGLESAITIIKQTKVSNAIWFRIEESSKSKVGNCIDSANTILKNKKYLKENQECIIA